MTSRGHNVRNTEGFSDRCPPAIHAQGDVRGRVSIPLSFDFRPPTGEHGDGPSREADGRLPEGFVGTIIKSAP